MTSSYAAAGVDVEAGELAVALMKASIKATKRPEVVGDFGGFAGLFDISAVKNYTKPLLATSTDGVGTKVAIAQAMDVHDTIGLDLVGMVVDDLVVCGAEPLFMTDYIATGKVIPARIASIVSGIAVGCQKAGCALIGGETAEHPGLLKEDEYDLAGAGTGVVEADHILGPQRVQAGDVVIAMASSGLHSNGYSLARHVFFTMAQWKLDRAVPEFGRSLGAELLEPTTIYSLDCLAIARDPSLDIHAFSHVTGGGLAANLARVLPADLHADLQRNSWQVPAIFATIGELGKVDRLELEKTLNMGIGMVAVVAASSADATLRALNSRGVNSWIVGEVRTRINNESSDAPAKGGGGGSVTLIGDYAK
ncbi:unannotated protein [freshwater metagenome]|uniref:phosphoribosylformylglycinamidine cyclo-ligase n=1 Tax=freshwater metagenome TaxID=449393 RepID=A0A6J7DUX9_9ZZZZ|nr:phosphoribosylformylglycinamidine cyclo-ligase [Actinomycetota bacterium]